MERINYARINVLYEIYGKMAIKAYNDYKIAIKNDSSIEESTYRLTIEKYITVVVFSAMAIEAYLYDILAIEFSDDFVFDHLDKQTALDKWVILHKHFNNDVNKSNELYSNFKKLLSTRNSFIHTKSKNLHNILLNENIDISKYDIINNGKNIDAKNAIKILFLIDMDIQKITESKYSYPYLFFNYNNIDNMIYSDEEDKIIKIIYKEIFKCRTSHSESEKKV